MYAIRSYYADMAKEKKAKDKKGKDGNKRKHDEKEAKHAKKRERADRAQSQRVTPYLLYRDVAAALDWLARTFDFSEEGDRFEGPDGTVQHAAMRNNFV